MSFQDNIELNEYNYRTYEDALIKIYSESFSGPPYYESRSPDDIRQKFGEWFIYKDNKLIIKIIDGDPVGFSFGYNASSNDDLDETRSIAGGAKTYFISEAAVSPGYRREYYAMNLLEHLIFANSDKYSFFVARANSNDQAGKNLLGKLNFIRTDEERAYRAKKGRNGSEISGERAWRRLDRRVRKTTYNELLHVDARDNGEKLVEANKFDDSILTEKSEIGLFPYDYDSRSLKVRETVAEKLRNVNKKLYDINPNYRLNVSYGFRENDIQNKAFQRHAETLSASNLVFDTIYDFLEEAHRFIAVPYVAGHPTGGAVDATIKDIKKGVFLDMGSLIYEFASDKIIFNAKGLGLEQKKNRQLLRDVMISEDFCSFWGEWWHYSFGDREWAALTSKDNAIYDRIMEKQ